MKSKSIVFFFAVVCLFLSHCTDAGSYYGRSIESVEISALERKINNIELELSDMKFKAENNQRCVCWLYKELQNKGLIDTTYNKCMGCFYP